MIRNLVYFFSFFVTTILVAQNSTPNENYIKYSEKVIISSSIQENNDTFHFGYKDKNESQQIKLKPNLERKLNFNFTYKLLDFSIGYTPSFLKTNLSQEKSKNFNFTLRFNAKNWMQTFVLIHQKGFHIDTNNNFTKYFPQLRSTKIGGTTSYIFNKNYSYSTLFNLNQWQTKSAGSFIPQFSTYLTNIKSKETQDFLDVNIFSMTLSPSYYYNFVINKKILIGAGVNLGFGANIVEKEIKAIVEFSNDIKIGYNTNNFFTSIGYNGKTFSFNNNGNRYQNSFHEFKLEIGIRFDPPNKAKKMYDNTIIILPIKQD